MFANFENDSFLLDCLMSCSRNTSVNLLDLTNEQLNKWSQLKNAPVISERIQQFEHILISIVLILLGLYLNTTKVRLTDYHKVIFNNQAKLFSHVLRKIHTFITSNKPNSAVLTNAIQSITMLKFFIDKNYDFSYEFKISRREELLIHWRKSRILIRIYIPTRIYPIFLHSTNTRLST